MSNTKRDNTRFRRKKEKPHPFSYKLHFGLYYKSHPCTYKKMLRRQRRAREIQALRENKDIPVFKNSDNSTYWKDW